MTSSTSALAQALKAIPSVDSLLGSPPFSVLTRRWRREVLRRYLQRRLDEYRRELREGAQRCLSREEFLAQMPAAWAARWRELAARGTRRILNGSGVLLHTNLGRAPLGAAARRAVSRAARWPVDLELDLSTGKRASRLRKLEELLCAFSGAPAALVVNNNAAALTLAVDTLARKRRLIVSRGEQVEIGGSFRLPEILERFAGKMVEVGTTNRTRLADYEGAITRRGDVLLKVHRSNFRQEGYVEETSLAELVDLGRRRSCPVLYDLGSGRFDDGPDWLNEPDFELALAAGPDLLTFSGDKIFGGPQAGIALGAPQIVGAMRANPLARALRLDKLNLAALLETVAQRAAKDGALPARELLSRKREEIGALAEALAARLRAAKLRGVSVARVSSQARSGGGAAAEDNWPSAALKITVKGLKAQRLARKLREEDPAVLGLLRQDEFYLDFAALSEDELPELERVLRKVIEKEAKRG